LDVLSFWRWVFPPIQSPITCRPLPHRLGRTIPFPRNPFVPYGCIFAKSHLMCPSPVETNAATKAIKKTLAVSLWVLIPPPRFFNQAVPAHCSRSAPYSLVHPTFRRPEKTALCVPFLFLCIPFFFRCFKVKPSPLWLLERYHSTFSFFGMNPFFPQSQKMSARMC